MSDLIFQLVDRLLFTLPHVRDHLHQLGCRLDHLRDLVRHELVPVADAAQQNGENITLKLSIVNSWVVKSYRSGLASQHNELLCKIYLGDGVSSLIKNTKLKKRATIKV